MKSKNKRKRRNPKFIGRPLLVRDETSARTHFLERDNVPPGYPCIFFAQEPFTVLGLSPQLSASDIADAAKIQSQKWKERLQTSNNPSRDNLIHIIEQAERILSEQCFPYRAFAKKYASLGRCYSKTLIRKAFFKTLIKSAPSLRRRQTLRNLKIGGIFSIPLLVAITFLVVVLTIPVGGITILGYTLFAQTLFVIWGPFALIPVLALMATGGFGAYWYRKHKHVFQELAGHFHNNLRILEALAFAIEDFYLLQAFELKQKEPDTFRVNQRQIKKEISKHMDELVNGFIQEFIQNLSVFTAEHVGSDKMDIAKFYQLLEEHPGEVEKCSEASLIQRLTVDCKTMLPVVNSS